MLLYFTISLFLKALLVSGSYIIYSNDTISLSLSSNTRNLVSSISSSHSLEWIIKNSGGSPGNFIVSQHSPHDIRGDIITESIFLASGQFATLKLDNIRIPAYSPQNSVITLTVNKIDASSDEQSEAAPGYRASVSSSVMLNLVSGTIQEETELPLVHTWVEQETGSACSYVTTCHEAHWLTEFSVHDTQSGLFSLRFRSLQDEDSRDKSSVFWWHDQFMVGGQEMVHGGAWVSCCVDHVVVEVEDVARNIIRAVQSQQDSDHWNIIIPVVITISIIIFIIICVISVCVYKNQYRKLSSHYV